MDNSATIPQQLITRLQLQPHPEGGYYRETYRSAGQVLRSSDGVLRSAATAIYYLLCDGAHSSWHRIQSDEVWHFYTGTPLLVHVLPDDGQLYTLRLGDASRHADVQFQAMVPAACWFAAECADPASYALAGCAVAPGFEFSEFELADSAQLALAFPQHRQLITRLGRTVTRA